MQTKVDLHTPHLHLRNLSVDDVPLVMQWAADPDVVKNFSFFERGADPSRIRSYISEKADSPNDLLMAVLEKKDGREVYAGNVGLHEWDAVNENARLGIILCKESWGRGIAQEALCGVMELAFKSLGLHKVYLNVFTSNEKGIHLYSKLGFVNEGVMRAEYKLRGKYQDLLRMSILKPEWPTPVATGLLKQGGAK